VFCVLFESHMITATEIAKKAGIARSSAYDILKTFTRKGYCNEIETSSVVKYEIIDPMVIEDKIEKDIKDMQEIKLSNLHSSFKSLIPLFKSREMKSEKVDVELIKGFNKHRFHKFMELFNSASKEILLMTKLEGHVDTELDQSTINFLKNGGVLRTLYEASDNFKINVDGSWQTMTKEKLADFCDTLAADGEEIKIADKIYQNILICDRQVVFVSLVDPTISRYNRSDIIVKNANYASAMADYFATCWASAYSPAEFKNKIGAENR